MKLDFIIPTKGRHDDLKRGLQILNDRIINECPSGLEVGVCISDSSEKALIPDFFADVCPGIKINYQHSPGILSFVENLRTAVFLSKADYVWLMGDDDFILPGALTNLAKWLKPGWNLLHVNALLKDSTNGHQCPLIPSALECDPPGGNVQSRCSVEEMTYMSCLIFKLENIQKKELWEMVYPSEVASHLRFVSDTIVSGVAVATATPMVVIEKNVSVVSEWAGHWCVLIGYEIPRVRHCLLGSISPSSNIKPRIYSQIVQELRMHLILCVFRKTYPLLARDAVAFRHEYWMVRPLKFFIYGITQPSFVRSILKKWGTFLDARCAQLN